MATVIVNNDANVQVANGGENMRLRNSMSIDNLLVAFPDNLPSDFMLKFTTIYAISVIEQSGATGAIVVLSHFIME